MRAICNISDTPTKEERKKKKKKKKLILRKHCNFFLKEKRNLKFKLNE